MTGQIQEFEIKHAKICLKSMIDAYCGYNEAMIHVDFSQAGFKFSYKAVVCTKHKHNEKRVEDLKKKLCCIDYNLEINQLPSSEFILLSIHSGRVLDIAAAFGFYQSTVNPETQSELEIDHHSCCSTYIPS